MDILRAMGVAPASANLAEHDPQFWLFCCDKNWNVLSDATRMVIRLYWRVAYHHLTMVTTNRKPFNAGQGAVKDLNRQVMARILAYQLQRRNFYLKRRYNVLQHVLPTKADKVARQVGTLDLYTGSLKIKRSLKEHFQKFEAIWNTLPGDTQN